MSVCQLVDNGNRVLSTSKNKALLPREKQGLLVDDIYRMKLAVHWGKSGLGSNACQASSVRRSLMGCLNS